MIATLQLTSLESDSPKLNIAVGFLNIIQWTVIALMPVIQVRGQSMVIFVVYNKVMNIMQLK